MKIKMKYLILIFGIAILNSGCIGINREFKNIRSQILESMNDDFDREIEFSVGPVGFFIASQFVKFADTEENVDEMLSKIRNIQIGVYNRLSNFSNPSFEILNNISHSFDDVEWKPIVKSTHDGELTGIFLKENYLDEINELFIVTLTEEELILVKLQGNLSSIIDIIIRDYGHEIKIAGNN
ncbi:MAG: DUF4252 domain-containing protein [Ignavibacteriae bacterium]|nr:DUF4252 domain-containing protein [Ignavibacteriota bacterium]